MVYASGRRDERHFIEPGTFMFKAEPVDQYGNLIDRHNLWEMVGVRYRRSLFPGFSDTAEYTLRVPGRRRARGRPRSRAGTSASKRPRAPRPSCTVTARLLYRKVDQYLLNFMFGEKAGLTMPVTEMARAEARIRVRPAPLRRRRGQVPRRCAWPRSGRDRAAAPRRPIAAAPHAGWSPACVLFASVTIGIFVARPRRRAYVPGREAETSGEITRSLERDLARGSKRVRDPARRPAREPARGPRRRRRHAPSGGGPGGRRLP